MAYYSDDDDDDLSSRGSDDGQMSDTNSNTGGPDDLDSEFNSMASSDAGDMEDMDDFDDPESNAPPARSPPARAPRNARNANDDFRGSPPLDDDDDDFDSDFDPEDLPRDDDDDDSGMRSMAQNFSAMNARSAAPAPPVRHQSSSPKTTVQLCVVCGIKPVFRQNGKTYPTCGMTCAAKHKASGGSSSNVQSQVQNRSLTTGSNRGGSSSSQQSTSSSTATQILCCVCGKRPAYHHNGKSYPTCGNTCANVYKTNRYTQLCCICGIKPAYFHNGKRYPTCGYTCASKYKAIRGGGGGASTYQRGGGGGGGGSSHHGGHRGGSSTNTHRGGQGGGGGGGRRGGGRHLCVICHKRPVYVHGPITYVTCGLTCLRILCNSGGDKSKCNYCHRRPRLHPHFQCGKRCRDRSRHSCLMCRVRPKLKKYHFCGKTCRSIALNQTPRICEVPKNHTTWKMVEKKFRSNWRQGTCPTVKNVYKIVESKTFLTPYDKYKKRVKNEHFRYHGTGRECKLGQTGVTKLCNSASCPICNILRTSFRISLAKQSGAFGAGVYTSSASNKAYSYSGASGVMLLNKVCLGRIRKVNAFNEVMSLPSGYDSVAFERQNDVLNETIVYSNDAIRPVFLITF